MDFLRKTWDCKSRGRHENEAAPVSGASPRTGRNPTVDRRPAQYQADHKNETVKTGGGPRNAGRTGLLKPTPGRKTMSISCGCGDSDCYYVTPDDFSRLEAKRRKRCVSCGDLIDIGAECVVFPCFRPAATLVEERIHGNEVPMAARHMCARCGEIFLNLSAYGYCVTLGGDMRDDLRAHQEATGFHPEQYAHEG